MITFGGKKLSAKERTRKWQRELRKQGRALDRDIRKANMQEKKIQREIKKYAKKGETSSIRILAKDLVKGRHFKERLYTAKAQINSVSMQLQSSLAMMKVSGVMEQSAGVMSAMRNLVKLPQVADAARTLSQEMMRAGIIQEMMDDTMEDVFDDEDMEEDVEEEVSKVVADILGPLPEAAHGEIKMEGKESVEEETNDIGEQEMEARLAALA